MRRESARPGKLGGPRPMSAAVAQVVAEHAPQTLLARVQLEWQPACGAEIARRAQPVSEREGVVTLACASAAWAQELDLMQLELLRRLNERLGEPRVDALRFRVGGAES